MVRAVNADPARYGLDAALPPDFIAWDVVAVFRRGVRWEGDLPVPAYYGGPVEDSIDHARDAIEDALVPTPIPADAPGSATLSASTTGRSAHAE